MIVPGWLEIVLRCIVAFVILLLISRVLITKSVSQLSNFEATSLLVIKIILAIGSFNISIPVGHLLIAVFSWTLFSVMVSYIGAKSVGFSEFIHGKAVPIIKDGKILEENLKKQKYSPNELLKQLRVKNVFKVADVEFASLESNGEISVLLKKEYQPVTAKDMQIPVAQIKEPQTVVIDGKVKDEALASIGLSRNWLEGELRKLDIVLDNVFLGQVDQFGELSVDLFNDQLKTPQLKEKQLLFSSIKKAQANLEQFSFETNDRQKKKVYEHCAKEIDEVINKVKKYLH